MASTPGVDALPTILLAPQEELRAAAVTRMEGLRQDRAAAVAAADVVFREMEQQCLNAVKTWRAAATPQDRALAALEVGRLQRSLAAQDEARQKARYPHRNVQKRKMQREVLGAGTQDKRLIEYPVFLSMPTTSIAADRMVSLSALTAEGMA